LYSQLSKPTAESELEIIKFVSDESIDRGFNDIKAKSVIFVGESGAGKPTMLDAMCNYLL